MSYNFELTKQKLIQFGMKWQCNAASIAFQMSFKQNSTSYISHYLLLVYNIWMFLKLVLFFLSVPRNCQRVSYFLPVLIHKEIDRLFLTSADSLKNIYSC